MKNDELKESYKVGHVEYKDKDYSYYYDGEVIILTPHQFETNFHFLFEKKKSKRIEENISGVTSSNNSILFINLKLVNVGNGILKSFVPAYIVAKNNTIDPLPNFESFETMTFYGGPINNFYNPQLLLTESDTYGEVKLKSIEEVKKDYVINKNITHFSVWSARQYSKWETPLKLVSYYKIEFKDSTDVISIIDYYIKVVNLFRFLFNRSNIIFKRVLLTKSVMITYGKNTRKKETVEYDFYVAPEPNTKIDLPRYVSSLKLLNVEDKIPDLYNIINDERAYLSHFPSNSNDERYINIDKYTKISSAFESWFDLVFPNFKSTKNQRYKAVKIEAIDSLEKLKTIFPSKEKTYIDRFINNIELLEGMLIEKLDYSLDFFEPAINDFAVQLKNSYNLSDKKLKPMMKSFNNKRDKLTHGNVMDMEFKSEEIISVLIVEKLIRCLIFYKAGFTIEQITELLKIENI